MGSKKILKFFDKLYSSHYIVYIGPWKKFKRYVKKRFGDAPSDDYATCRGLASRIHMDDGSFYHVIWMPEYDHNEPRNVATLSHELLHCAVYEITEMNDDNRYAITKQNDEHLAYYHSYILTEVLNVLGRKKL